MSISVPFNGSTYIIPTPNEIGWGTNLDNYFVAIANGTLQNIGGNFVLSNDVDFGGTNGVKSVYYKTRSTNIAASGQFRLANNSDSITWRNFLNNGDLALLVNASNQLTFNGSPIQSTSLTSAHIYVGNASNIATDTAMSGDVAITNTGVTSVNNVQNNVITDAMVNSSAAIALSKLAALSTAKALQSNSSTGFIEASSVTNTELGYLSGVTSAIQTQLNSKLNLSGGTLTGDLTFASNKGIFFTDNTSNTVKITAPTSVTTYSLKWPIAQGAMNQYLTNDGSGNLSWTNAAGTGTVNTGTQYQLAYYATSTNAVSGNSSIITSATGQLLVNIASSTYKFHVKGGNSNTAAIDNDGSQFTELDFLHNGTLNTQLYWDNTAGNFNFNSNAPIKSNQPYIINATSGSSNQLEVNGVSGFGADTVRLRTRNTNSTGNAAIIVDVESSPLVDDAYFSALASVASVAWSWGLDGSDSGAFCLTKATTLNGTNIIRIDPTTSAVAINDLVDISNASAGQIKFPSSQHASANANTLDDYSEGTWSPTLTGWTNTGTPTVTGTYTKIGNLVFVTVRIAPATNISATTTTSHIDGLPFTPAQTAGATACNESNGGGYSCGLINTNGSIYPTTTGVLTSVFVMSGCYRV